MVGTPGERYAVVSCHVERPLDDRVWEAFAHLQERRPGGFAIAALLRPPDTATGEAPERWLERAREAADRGPVGHHTHWTSPTHARPTGGEEPGTQVLREGAWLREHGLAPTLFCGGGWYTDAGVARACAELGYVDCTPRARRPPYLPATEPWAELAEPAWIRCDGEARFLAVPTTHSIGDLARAVWRRGLPARVHVYFHDTDLLDRRRRVALVAALVALARRRPAMGLDAAAASVSGAAPEVSLETVARGRGAA